MKLKFIGKSSRLQYTLDQILSQISEELQLEKERVNTCLDGSLYQIKHNHIRNFQHLDEEDQLFFIDFLTNCFETKLAKELDSDNRINHVKALIQNAATIAINMH